MKKQWSLVLLFAVSLNFAQQGIPNYQPSEENLNAREWFQEARFGLFIHWELSFRRWRMGDEQSEYCR